MWNLIENDLPAGLIADDLDVDRFSRGGDEDALDEILIHPCFEFTHPNLINHRPGNKRRTRVHVPEGILGWLRRGHTVGSNVSRRSAVGGEVAARCEVSITRSVGAITGLAGTVCSHWVHSEWSAIGLDQIKNK
jgi:hypothetical protein